jgi:hypothetical protein
MPTKKSSGTRDAKPAAGQPTPAAPCEPPRAAPARAPRAADRVGHARFPALPGRARGALGPIQPGFVYPQMTVFAGTEIVKPLASESGADTGWRGRALFGATVTTGWRRSSRGCSR